MIYRDTSPLAAPASENNDWQDWPRDSSPPGGSGTEATLWLAKWIDAPIAKEYQPSQRTEHRRQGTRAAGRTRCAEAASARRQELHWSSVYWSCWPAAPGNAHYWATTGRYLVSSRYLVSTDDAYVGAKNAMLAAKVMVRVGSCCRTMPASTKAI